MCSDLIEAWVKSKKVVPYRNSKLSLVLQDSLTDGNVMMFLFYPLIKRHGDFIVDMFLEREDTHKVLFSVNEFD